MKTELVNAYVPIEPRKERMLNLETGDFNEKTVLGYEVGLRTGEMHRNLINGIQILPDLWAFVTLRTADED